MNKKINHVIKPDNYIIINLIFAGLISLMWVYSGIFSASNPHPINSVHTDQVISTGLSRAFSEIVRLNFNAAIEFNPYSIQLFSFFFIQFWLRLAFLFLMFRNIFRKNIIVLADVLISVLLFLSTFGQFISAQL